MKNMNDDLISRKAVLSLPRNTTRNFFGEIVDESIDVADIEALPSAQPEHLVKESGNLVKGLVNDCISRQAAIKALHDEIVRRRIDEDTNDDGTLDEFDTEAILRRLPSAQPEQIARDIATIIENEQDMRVILNNEEHTETHSCDCERTETHAQWISVSEALPEDGVTVWVTIKGHDVIRCEDGETLEQAIARIGKIRWVTQGYWSEEEHGWNDPSFGCPLMVQPIAWMPIETPEPWKGR